MMSEIGQIKGAAAIVSGDEKDETTLGVTAKGDKTFVVELETQVPFFMTLMYFPLFYPLNEQFYTSLEEGTYGTSPDTFLSCGAFDLTSHSLGTANLLLEKNPIYWNADAIALDSLTYQVVGSSDSALMAFESNYLDIVMIGGNYGRWSSEEYDRIIADCTKGRLVSDYNARWAALHDAESLVMREAVIAPLFTKADVSLINPAVQGVEFHPVGVGRAFKNARVT